MHVHTPFIVRRPKTDSELNLFNLCFALCNYWLGERGGGGGAPPPPLGETLLYV